MQESAILFGMNNVASNGQQFLNNFYLKSKRSVEKAKKEGPAAWVLAFAAWLPTQLMGGNVMT